MNYRVYVAGKCVDKPSVLCDMPSKITDVASLKHLVEVVNSSNTCIGNPEPRFQTLATSRNGSFQNRSGKKH